LAFCQEPLTVLVPPKKFVPEIVMSAVTLVAVVMECGPIVLKPSCRVELLPPCVLQSNVLKGEVLVEVVQPLNESASAGRGTSSAAATTPPSTCLRFDSIATPHKI
jgi:hypothetical protein